MVNYYLYRPFKRSTFASRLCSWKLFKVGNFYVVTFGILGVCLSLIDILRVLRSGSTLPCSMWRGRIKTGKIVSPERERDLKLISLIFSLEYYFFLVWGIVSNNQLYLLPWLFFYGVTIGMEFLIFVLHLYTQGLERNKKPLLLSMFLVYNWLTVHCIYQKPRGCY